MTRLWKVMETLIEGYGFDRDDSSYTGYRGRDIFFYDDGVMKVTMEVLFDMRDVSVDDIRCIVAEGDDYETVYDEWLNDYDIRNLSDFLDQLYKDYQIV